MLGASRKRKKAGDVVVGLRVFVADAASVGRGCWQHPPRSYFVAQFGPGWPAVQVGHVGCGQTGVQTVYGT